MAKSSIVHREHDSDRKADNVAMFRREKIRTLAGAIVQVPIVSGNSFRGVLRRIGEDLTAAALNYEGALPVAAAHLLTNGGRLAKSASPLTDEDQRRLTTLLPQLAVFGGSASGRLMGGLLKVGKVMPEVAEVAHILDRPPTGPLLPARRLLTEEFFSHLGDHRTHTDQAPRIDRNDETTTSPFGRFGVETISAGTRLQTWVLITNATDHQTAFLRDVLDIFARRGHLGGRIAAGHGTITATLTPDVQRGQLPDDTVDWQTRLTTHRDDVIAALSKLS